MWTLAFGHHEDRTPTHSYAATRGARQGARVRSGQPLAREWVKCKCRAGGRTRNNTGHHPGATAPGFLKTVVFSKNSVRPSTARSNG
jgi:hypothetical protein